MSAFWWFFSFSLKSACRNESEEQVVYKFTSLQLCSHDEIVQASRRDHHRWFDRFHNVVAREVVFDSNLRWDRAISKRLFFFLINNFICRVILESWSNSWFAILKLSLATLLKMLFALLLTFSSDASFVELCALLFVIALSLRISTEIFDVLERVEYWILSLFESVELMIKKVEE